MPKERNSVKYKIWRIVVSTPFEYFIMGLIVLNTVLLMMKVSVNESLPFPPKKSPPLFLLKMRIASRGKSDEFSCDRAMLTQDGEEHQGRKLVYLSILFCRHFEKKKKKKESEFPSSSPPPLPRILSHSRVWQL